jgi:amino acid transporter
VSGVREVEPGVYRITSEPRPLTGLGAMLSRGHKLLLGRPIASRFETKERLGIAAAIGVLGADMIASTVYGPEEMMRTLTRAGQDALPLALPLAVGIALLLAVLVVSYRQTVEAYPSGAGGYVVASDNLGPIVGLVGAAALMIDYTLDVAVSIATGVQSASSALPTLAPHRVWIALAILALITGANLRGIRTSGALFAAPALLYIGGVLAVIGYGLVQWTTGTLGPYEPPPAAAEHLDAAPLEALGLLLILRAFASGAVALTGVEAVSNGVPYMRPPEVPNAQRALLTMAAAFAALFLGISFLASRVGVVSDPHEVETVVSQLTRTIVGPGPVHLAVQGVSILMLVLAANTGFADLPRVLSLLARDGYVPEPFGFRNARLSFGNGILLAAILSAVLIVAFRGSVAGLVPLFTVGAFLTFTLSQFGMVRHWWRRKEQGWRHRAAVNAVGAAVTAVVLAVVVVSKFADGAWFVVVLIPALVVLMRGIGQHHRWMAEHIHLDGQAFAESPSEEARRLRHHILLPVGEVNRATLHAAAYARSIAGLVPGQHEGAREGAPVVEAVHVTDDLERGHAIRRRWEEMAPGVPLVLLESPHRDTAGALLRYLDLTEQRHRGTPFVVTVLLPETVPPRWWQQVLHNPMELLLKASLLFRRGTVVTSVPYHVPEPASGDARSRGHADDTAPADDTGPAEGAQPGAPGSA